jgi:hypothetical protein
MAKILLDALLKLLRYFRDDKIHGPGLKTEGRFWRIWALGYTLVYFGGWTKKRGASAMLNPSF